jgi:putative hemolysin
VTASQVLAATPQAAPSRYALVLTTDPDAVRAAQRLRHRVFADELGARPTDEPGVDVDRFDAFCDHLIVREDRTGERSSGPTGCSHPSAPAPPGRSTPSASS